MFEMLQCSLAKTKKKSFRIEEVLHALDIIRRQLQYKREDMGTCLCLERQMQDSMQINKQQLCSISLKANKCSILYLPVFVYFLSKNKMIALYLL